MVGPSPVVIVRTVASAYRTATRLYRTAPLRCVVRRLSESCGGIDIEIAPTSAIAAIDVSDLYVGNRQLQAIAALAARCPNLTLLALRRQSMFSADVLLAEGETGRGRSDVKPTSGSTVMDTITRELAQAEGYRAIGLPLVLDLRDNAELGSDAARRIQQLVTEAVFVVEVLLDGSCIDSIALCTFICVSRATRLAGRSRSRINCRHDLSAD